MLKLTGLTLEGFKSFAAEFSLDNLPGLPGRGRMTNRLALGDVTVLIGPNGAGKSNITSFFRMLSFMMTGALQEYVVRSGEADSILHNGLKHTARMRAILEFEDQEKGGRDKYEFTLLGVPSGAFVFADESIEYSRQPHGNPYRRSLGELHKESLLDSVKGEDQTAGFIRNILGRCRFYQFHDTSAEAKIRLDAYIEDNSFLRSDAGNLAAFLYGLKSRSSMEAYYSRIERSVQLAFPQLRQFVLEPRAKDESRIRLNWSSRAVDGYLFGPHQVSDGALRFAALTTLLLQPPDMLPGLIVLDEPELGLHPEAIVLLAEMIKGVAQQQKQVLVATQSPLLVNQFSLSQIRPIEFRDGRSVILDLDPEAYEEWLDEYSTGELWQKNLIGGGPTHG